MPEYRVITGTHRTGDGDRAETGDVIDIAESVAEDFPNKFERVESDDDETASVDEAPPEDPADPEADVAAAADSNDADDGDDGESVAESESEDDESDGDDEAGSDGIDSDDIGAGEDSADIPDDYALLSKMAKNYDGDDIHGKMAADDIVSVLESLPDTEVAALKTQAREEISGDG